MVLADFLSALGPVNRKVDRLFLCHRNLPVVMLRQLRALEPRVLDKGGSIFNARFVSEAQGNSNPKTLAAHTLALARQDGIHQSLGEALRLGPFPDREPMELELQLDSLGGGFHNVFQLIVILSKVFLTCQNFLRFFPLPPAYLIG